MATAGYCNRCDRYRTDLAEPCPYCTGSDRMSIGEAAGQGAAMLGCGILNLIWWLAPLALGIWILQGIGCVD